MPRLWTRWKRLAHRAAEIQAMAVLSLLYWAVVVPAGVVKRRRSSRAVTPAWTRRPAGRRATVEDARRQF